MRFRCLGASPVTIEEPYMERLVRAAIGIR